MSDARARASASTVRDELMAEYLRVSEQMLATQREVMLAYLNDDTPDPEAADERPVRRVRTLRLLEPADATSSGSWLLVGRGPRVNELAALLRSHGSAVRVADDLSSPVVDVAGVLLTGPLSEAPRAALPDVHPHLTWALKSGVGRLVALTGGGTESDGLAGTLRALRLGHPHAQIRLVDITDRAPEPTLLPEVATEVLRPALPNPHTPPPAPGAAPARGVVPTAGGVPASREGTSVAADRAAEVTRWGGRWFRAEMTPQPITGDPGSAAELIREAGLEPGSVVLVSGGFHGVAADLVRDLARAGCRVDLAGPTAPEPPAEAPAPVSCEDEGDAETARDLADLYAALARSGGLLPGAVDLQAREALASRQVGQLLADLATTRTAEGHLADVVHHRLDTADESEAVRLVKTVLADRGRLDLVVHVTGVTEHDRTFAGVYATEARAARSLLNALTESGTSGGSATPTLGTVLLTTIDAPAESTIRAGQSALSDTLGRIGDRYATTSGSRTVTITCADASALAPLALLGELAHGEPHLTQVTYS